jgi:1-acyl-sn-glycerol-3-phosphate acyltransferase
VIAGLLRLVTGAQARWKGTDPIRPDGAIPQRVFFANHTSNLDAPVIWASLPTPVRRLTRPVAARDYWEAAPVRRKIARDYSAAYSSSEKR